MLYDWDSFRQGCFSNLTGAIFGNRIKESDKKALCKILTDIDENIKLMDAKLSSNEFGLDIVEIDSSH